MRIFFSFGREAWIAFYRSYPAGFQDLRFTFPSFKILNELLTKLIRRFIGDFPLKFTNFLVSFR